MKVVQFFVWALLALMPLAAGVIDLRQMPYSDEVHIVAIDIKVNPTNMPSQMLWDDPILMIYRQVPNFISIDVDAMRAEATEEFQTGQYKPVVLRTKQGQDLTLHLLNLIGTGDAPERVVQGVVCKNCKKAYTFGYGQGLERTRFPFPVSLHGHGMSYTIDNDGTNAGNNVAVNPNNYGLASPGETRTYYYQKLDSPGIWPIHDHAHPAHTVTRGLHMALVVEELKAVVPDHDFVIIFSDYPDYDDYQDEFYSQTFIPAFLHMRNGNVMHAHALNGYAAMMPPRMNKAVATGHTIYDMMRTDILPEPRTPVFDVDMGKLVRFRLLSMGSSMATHSFHIHGHVWYDEAQRKYRDSVSVPSGESYELMFYAGGQAFRRNAYTAFRGSTETPVSGFIKRSGAGDWLYHCHVVPHVKHGMWGLFRVKEVADGADDVIDADNGSTNRRSQGKQEDPK